MWLVLVLVVQVTSTSTSTSTINKWGKIGPWEHRNLLKLKFARKQHFFWIFIKFYKQLFSLLYFYGNWCFKKMYFRNSMNYLIHIMLQCKNCTIVKKSHFTKWEKCGNSKFKVCAKIQNLLGFLQEELLDWMLLRTIQTLRGLFDREMFKVFDKFQRKILRNLHDQTIALKYASKVQICVPLKQLRCVKICVSTQRII